VGFSKMYFEDDVDDGLSECNFCNDKVSASAPASPPTPLHQPVSRAVQPPREGWACWSNVFGRIKTLGALYMRKMQ